MSNPDDSKKDKDNNPETVNEEVQSDTPTVEENNSEGVEEENKTQKGDDFFEDAANTKKKSSPLIPFIIVLFLCAAFLVAGYIYNIMGLRDKANNYDFDHIPNIFQSSVDDITPEFIQDTISVTEEDAVVEEEASLEASEDGADKIVDEEKTIAEEVQEDIAENSVQDHIISEVEESVASEGEEEIVTLPKDESTVSEENKTVEQIVQTVIEYVPAYALTKEEYIEHKSSIRKLNKAIYKGESFIDELVIVRGIFPELDLSIMTEYSTVGKPNKFSVSRQGLDAVKRAAVLEEYDLDAGIESNVSAFIRKLVVITPVKDIDENELDGQLSLIKNAFQQGTFKEALELIEKLPDDRKEEFSNIVKVIDDLYALKAEMRLIDDALTELLYNNKNN